MTQTTPSKAVPRAQAAIAECRLIATMSEDAHQITRRFLTAPVAQVHAHLRARMASLGMAVHTDALGNLRGLWQPQSTPASLPARRILIGSHIDTVPNAGAFDGVLGVVLALHLVEQAKAESLPLAIEVIAFSEEEGVRFGVPFLGSRAVAGRFDPALLDLRDHEGVSVREAITRFGLDPASIDEAVASEDAIAYLELHIEQGPVLESENISLGVVTAISGQSRYTFRFQGQANHAGATPMHLRRDALAAAAEWITRIEDYTLANRDIEGLLCTVGALTVQPGASNVIPGAVELTLDIRCPNRYREDAATTAIRHAQVITQRRGLTFTHALTHDKPHVRTDPALTAALAAAVQSTGLPLRKLPSGAGHDAMVVATRIPTAMLFLRSPGGISHHPEESVIEQDVEASLLAASAFLRHLSESQ